MATENIDKTAQRSNNLKVHFFVESINKISPPEGMTGDDWHSYIIGYGASKIEGKKPGSLTSVTQHANTVVEDLNARADIKNNNTYAANKNSANKIAANKVAAEKNTTEKSTTEKSTTDKETQDK